MVEQGVIVKHCMVFHSIAQHITRKHCLVWHSTNQETKTQHSTSQHSASQHNRAQDSPEQHKTAQHRTAQHCKLAQYNTVQEAQKSTEEHQTAKHSNENGVLNTGTSKHVKVRKILQICISSRLRKPDKSTQQLQVRQYRGKSTKGRTVREGM